MSADTAALKASWTFEDEWQAAGVGGRGQNNTPKETALPPWMELSGHEASTHSRRMTAQCVEIGKVGAEEVSEK